MTDGMDIVKQLRITAERYGGDFYTESIVTEAADEIERLRADNQMMKDALSQSGINQTVKTVLTTSLCDVWAYPIFAKNNHHLCDICNGEKFNHSYESVPDIMPFGSSYKPWSLELLEQWRNEEVITEERYHFLCSVTEDFDKPIENAR